LHFGGCGYNILDNNVDSEIGGMKILLIQPSEQMVTEKLKTKGSVMPSLGLLFLASSIRESMPGICIDVVDYEARNGEPEPDFSKYDIVGLTGTSVHMPHAISLAKRVRQSTSEACIVFGGPHATFCHQELLDRFPEIDAIVRGEGEIAFRNFISRYRGRLLLPTVEGISTRERHASDLAPIVSCIDELPEPAYDLVDFTRYRLSTHRRILPLPFATMLTSRGCPYSCIYCQTPKMFGPRLRYHSAEYMKHQLTALRKFGIRSVVLVDDTFTANRQHAVDYCESARHEGLEWMCNTRVECVDRSLLRIMKKSGCSVIFYGVESGSQETLTRLGRLTTKSRLHDVFEWTRQEGIRTVGTLMIGAPGDDSKKIEENIEFLKSLEPSYVYISIYNVTPGSSDFERASRQGRIRSKEGKIVDSIDWSDPSLYHGSPFGLPTVNESLNRYQLQIMQKYAYEQFYGPTGGTEYE
jgi:anaerobic magnesium-protoporphyrin IX monomethyl ester cyclase